MEHEAQVTRLHRFRALAAAFRELHEQWRTACRAGDLERQSALITQECALLAEARQVLAASQEHLLARVVGRWPTLRRRDSLPPPGWAKEG